MHSTTRNRIGSLAVLAAFLVAACTGGTGTSAPASVAPSTGASVEPSAAESVAPSAAAVTLTYLVDDTEATQARANGLIAAYTAKNPHVTIEVETRPGGSDGDNIVKTRLATGDMPDLFWYNSGSLLQALNPSETLVDLSAEPFIADLSESFIPTVSQGDGIFGVPSETAMGGGILYNKKIYADLSLTVPTTWAEFAANNETIKTAGIAPVGATFAGDSTWTSQLFVLADFYNLQTSVPDFAEKYTANQAHYADTPAAKVGFQRLEESFTKGWWQEDFGSASFDDGLNMLATGEIAHYPMLTFALGTIAENHPDAIADIGFFGQPGDDAATNGATIWMPAATYIPKTSEHIDEATAFLAFIASVEGTEALTAASAPSGPYVVKGSSLPADTLPAVLDIQAYLDKNAAGPALEFLSPVKGPALEQITVEVGSGLRSADDAAALYDQDVAKQAKQLGLPGWD
jgi:raffinose/stachyose/melibiose transport system substrate-binding protein